MSRHWKHLILALLIAHLAGGFSPSKPVPKSPQSAILWQGLYGQQPTPVPLGGK